MSILNDIIEWVENKSEFWQVAIDRLIQHNNLTVKDIDEIKEICKKDYGLSEIKFNPVDFEHLKEFVSKSTTTDSITISKIFNINNINALSNTSLEFAPSGLTVVYGDNGVGKSSYVSILKHVCKSRGNKPKINGNLLNPGIYGYNKSAEVQYTRDGLNFLSICLNNEEISSLILKCVDVFDASSAHHYIEGEDEIAFIPYGLSIVEKFAKNLIEIEHALTAEVKALIPLDIQLIEVSESSSAHRFLQNINLNSENDLQEESLWDTAKEDRLEELKKVILQLLTTDPKKELKNIEEKIRRFEVLKNKFLSIENKLTGAILEETRIVKNNAIIAEEALRAASEKAFSELPIEGVGNESWKILWESARTFYNKSKKEDIFPESEYCPLCLQELSQSAKNRFRNFEEFVKEDIQKRCNDSSEKLKSILKSLESLSFQFQEQEPIITELDEQINNFNIYQKKYVDKLEEQRNYLLELLKGDSAIKSIVDIPVVTNCPYLIEKLILKLKDTNEKLKNESIDDKVMPLQQEMDQLRGNKKIYELKDQLTNEIKRLKKVDQLNSCISKCKTNSVTILSNELTNKYITQNLKDNFKSELSKLGFNNIQITTETKGSRGKQNHYLKLDDSYPDNISLKDILSEGEHRAISLATFFSELSLSEHKSAIIFDDPVCSLDHKWRNRIAKRIAEESMNRQVIVFTHDITFLLMLQEQSKKEIEVKTLTRRKSETGIIGNSPPWDAMAITKRIGELNKAFQNLEKLEKNETGEIYNEKAKIFYGKLRETWERLVEELLLNKVVQRFSREIQTQRLKILSDLSDRDYQIIEFNMSKCSKYFFGHDSSGELIENMPISDEIKEDVLVLTNYVAELRKRKRN